MYQLPQKIYSAPGEQFRDAIREAGLEPPDLIEPGKLHRFSTNGKARDDAGWCKLFADLCGGVFGDHRSGLSALWQARRDKPYPAAEREAFQRGVRRNPAPGASSKNANVTKQAAKETAALLAGAVTGDPATPSLSRQESRSIRAAGEARTLATTRVG